MQINDLDFADNIALLSHTHKQMQVKTTTVVAASTSVNLNIHKGRTKILEYNAENTNPITLDGPALEEVETFTYVVSIIDERERSDADVKAQIGKVRTAFI
ncbi:unnamed protein product [Schistosoma curassoni]|uniref:Reverse transcriptase domain-containing protein n=1 Tax=Schistosoma curassoni TaxID=6186 RepID=A0A183KKP5_9TREM|nr:unnamed protein product [Schistosoma curassoni]